MQTQLLSKDFKVQCLLDEIQGCLTSIRAQTELDPTDAQIQTLEQLRNLTEVAHQEILEEPTKAQPKLKLPAEDLGIQNFSDHQGRKLARQLKHSGGTLRGIGDSHSAWGGNVKTQVKPTYVTAGGLTLSID